MATTILDSVWLGWTPRESGSKGFRDVNGDHGHAQGKYQFDYRYALVGFLKYCAAFNQSRYGGFLKFANYGVGSSKLVNNAELANLWTSICDKYPAEFEALQDAYAYTNYYLSVKKYLQSECKINLDNHHPVVRGSAFSMSIRSGALSAARKFKSAGCTDSMADTTILKKTYATYGNEDAKRWTADKQLGDALSALTKNTYSIIEIDGTTATTKLVSGVTAESSTPSSAANIETENMVKYTVAGGLDIEPVGIFDDLDKAFASATELLSTVSSKAPLYVYGPNKELLRTATKTLQTYRVGTGWQKSKCLNQKGAFSILSNALAACTDGYFVFNSIGNKIASARTNVYYRVAEKYEQNKYVGQEGAYSILDNAIEDLVKFARKNNKAYYIFDNSGNVIYSAIPK